MNPVKNTVYSKIPNTVEGYIKLLRLKKLNNMRGF